MNKKIVRFTINHRIIKYYDDIWKYGIQLMPMDSVLVRNFMLSRSENLKEMAKLIRESNTGEELMEYNRCKTDEALAEMVRKDAKNKGLMEVTN